MPVYEYHCAKCDHEFEREQRITDDPIKTCPNCRSRKVKKLISQTSFVLKGGGWYSDLYSSSKDSKSDGKEGKDGKDSKDGKSGKDEGGKSSEKSKSGSDKPSKSGTSETKSKKKSPKSAA